MRQKIEAIETYSTVSAEGDSIGLLKIIKAIAYNFQSQKYLPHALHEAKKTFHLLYQPRHMTVPAYLEVFQNTVDVIGHIGGIIGIEPGMKKAYNIKLDRDEDTELTPEEELVVQDQYLATAFILSSDRTRYGKLIENLENDYLQSRDHYPTTLTAAYNLLTNWKQDPKNQIRGISGSNDGVSFANMDGDEDDPDQDVSLNTNGKAGKKKKEPRDKSTIKCRRCGQMGHWPSECDNPRLQPATENEESGGTESGAALVTAGSIMDDSNDEEGMDDIIVGFQFLNENSVTQGVQIPKTWILLDSQSTVDVFHNKKLLQNIRDSGRSMAIHCTAGVTTTRLVGDLPGYGKVWYHPNGIANILSLARVKAKGYTVTYDSAEGNHFIPRL